MSLSSHGFTKAAVDPTLVLPNSLHSEEPQPVPSCGTRSGMQLVQPASPSSRGFAKAAIVAALDGGSGRTLPCLAFVAGDVL
jgi:hypothetical protein